MRTKTQMSYILGAKLNTPLYVLCLVSSWIGFVVGFVTETIRVLFNKGEIK